MSETERSLLDAVLISPHDDGPRLVYADWLDENGDGERAEYIRCEIAIERWANTPSNEPGGTAEDGGPAGAALATADGLFERYGKKWTPKIPGVKFRWKRGFISEIECTLSVFVGGTCGKCDGVGSPHRNNHGIECRDCKGYGVCSGIVGVVGPYFPIVSATICDREPRLSRNNARGSKWEYGWWRQSVSDSHVPDGIFALMRSRHPFGYSQYVGYRSRLAAMTALSEGATDFLRKCSSLPTIYNTRAVGAARPNPSAPSPPAPASPPSPTTNTDP